MDRGAWLATVHGVTEGHDLVAKPPPPGFEQPPAEFRYQSLDPEKPSECVQQRLHPVIRFAR